MGSVNDLKNMSEHMLHRGPDGAGLFFDENLGIYMGHRRLAIIDIAGGLQPMWNSDKSLCVVFNGELYNHLDLRRELEKLGHVFQTDHSDTEVLLWGYKEWGDAVSKKLNGMFAFCIYDVRKKSFFLSRDRFGEKPLYIYRSKNLFAFASEIKALAQHESIKLVYDSLGLAKYFGWGYVPSPKTIYKNIEKLQAGFNLTIDLLNFEETREKYWSFSIDSEFSSKKISLVDASHDLRHLVKQSVRRRCMSDAPLGIFLSGGIDSSAIVAAARSEFPESEILTFTMGFEDVSFDERSYASSVAKLFNTNHREISLSYENAIMHLPQIIEKLDEPFVDPSVVPTYFVSSFARKYIKVALSGDGADELFAGYDPFSALYPSQVYGKFISPSFHKFIERLVSGFPATTSNMSLEFKIKRTLMGMNYNENMRMPSWMSPAHPEIQLDLLENNYSTEEIYEEAIQLWDDSPGKCIVSRTLDFFTRFYLQDNILLKTDTASMMSSLEARSVFLDNDIVEFCQKLPSNFKFDGVNRKIILKKSLSPMLPNKILNRRKKGFGLPIASWIKKMSPPPFDSVPGVRADIVAKLWQDHISGITDNKLVLWGWLVLAGKHNPLNLEA